MRLPGSTPSQSKLLIASAAIFWYFAATSFATKLASPSGKHVFDRNRGGKSNGVLQYVWHTDCRWRDHVRGMQRQDRGYARHRCCGISG
jgi:hypothetical protein